MNTIETLTLDRLLRAACQTVLHLYADRTEPLCTASAGAAEDVAIERCQVLLTPEARLTLAAELIRSLPCGEMPVIGLGRNAAARDLVHSLPGAWEPLEKKSAMARLGGVLITASVVAVHPDEGEVRS